MEGEQITKDKLPLPEINDPNTLIFVVAPARPFTSLEGTALIKEGKFVRYIAILNIFNQYPALHKNTFVVGLEGTYSASDVLDNRPNLLNIIPEIAVDIRSTTRKDTSRINSRIASTETPSHIHIILLSGYTQADNDNFLRLAEYSYRLKRTYGGLISVHNFSAEELISPAQKTSDNGVAGYISALALSQINEPVKILEAIRNTVRLSLLHVLVKIIGSRIYPRLNYVS